MTIKFNMSFTDHVSTHVSKSLKEVRFLILFDGDNDSLNAQFIWNENSNKGAVIFNTEIKICLQVYPL